MGREGANKSVPQRGKTLLLCPLVAGRLGQCPGRSGAASPPEPTLGAVLPCLLLPVPAASLALGLALIGLHSPISSSTQLKVKLIMVKKTHQNQNTQFQSQPGDLVMQAGIQP